MVQLILPVLQLILATCNILIMLYAFSRFINKPRTDMDSRVKTLEIEIKEIKESLFQGNDRFRKQESTNEVLIHSVLALIEFEIQYCLTEHKDMSDGLKQAKKDLNDFLAGKKL